MDKLETKEREIESELKRIREDEVKILSEEGQVLKAVKNIERYEILGEQKSLNHFSKFRRLFIREASKHKFIFSMTVVFGVVLIWRGLWDVSEQIPIISDSIIALFVGMAILWFIERYSNLG